MNEKLFATLQYLIPQHALSRAAGWLAETRIEWIKNPFTKWFVNRYEVDMSEAVESDPTAYACFNDFFTRALKDGARPICDAADAIVCPADGAVSQAGSIQDGRIFQAKGQEYTVLELLGGNSELADQFSGGQFATIYLSPKDYHRVHMPLNGTLTRMIHIPGDLFSVNHATATHVPRLFARNERLVCLFDTDAGPMAVVLVGAVIVASIETPWAGLITPVKRMINTTRYDLTPDPIRLAKGEEMGRFKLGSTAIVLFGADVMKWEESLTAETATRMGERMGTLTEVENPERSKAETPENTL